MCYAEVLEGELGNRHTDFEFLVIFSFVFFYLNPILIDLNIITII